LGVLISRCAWHRRYHGYTKVLGISSWEGLQLSFTDGICQKCAARVRADHLRSRYDRGASADRREPPWVPGLVALTLGLVVTLVLIARPTHELPPPPVVAMMPPPVAVVPPAPLVSAPAPRAVASASPRHRLMLRARPVLVAAPDIPRIAPVSALPRVVVPVATVAALRIPPPRYAHQSP
jgi:hypothetical protein